MPLCALNGNRPRNIVDTAMIAAGGKPPVCRKLIMAISVVLKDTICAASDLAHRITSFFDSLDRKTENMTDRFRVQPNYRMKTVCKTLFRCKTMPPGKNFRVLRLQGRYLQQTQTQLNKIKILFKRGDCFLRKGGKKRFFSRVIVSPK